MYRLHVKLTQKCMRHAMIPKYILTPILGFLPQIVYRYMYVLSSTLIELKPEVKVTVTWKHLVTRQCRRCRKHSRMGFTPQQQLFHAIFASSLDLYKNNTLSSEEDEANGFRGQQEKKFNLQFQEGKSGKSNCGEEYRVWAKVIQL